MADYRQYLYVGPDHLQRLRRQGDCISPRNAMDLHAWARRQFSPGKRSVLVPATFVVDSEEQLWVAERGSEHIACADGGPVLAAGELFLFVDETTIRVQEVSNQSTGFCPEPECWAVIARVLDKIGVERPNELTHAFVFRKCPACGIINLVKDDVLECVCGAALPIEWNFFQQS